MYLYTPTADFRCHAQLGIVFGTQQEKKRKSDFEKIQKLKI